MINANMRTYDYFTLGAINSYGQSVIPTEPVGKIKMMINISSQAVQDNILYENCTYVGLTHAPIDDTYIIDYGGKRLKVLYVNPNGRYTQVFMTGMD